MDKKSKINGWGIFGIIWFVIQTYRFGKRGITEGDWGNFLILYGGLLIIIIYFIYEKYKKKNNTN